MALENFRRTDIQIDRANDYITKTLFAKEGDYNGRELVVQITDGGLEIDTTGTQLLFNWKHLKKGNSGAEYFRDLEIEKGRYVIVYPQEMLIRGPVEITITVISPNGTIPLRSIPLTVEKGVDGDYAVAEDNFYFLQQALMKISMYQAEIDQIKQSLINQGDELLKNEKAEFDKLQEEYSPLLLGLQQQFDDAIANVTVDSEVITARTSTVTGETYNTLGNHMDAIENRQLIHSLDSGKEHIATLEVANGQPRLKIEEVM